MVTKAQRDRAVQGSTAIATSAYHTTTKPVSDFSKRAPQHEAFKAERAVKRQKMTKEADAVNEEDEEPDEQQVAKKTSAKSGGAMNKYLDGI
jgi:hypothetical protein